MNYFTLPKIGVVIIGVNVEKYLADCIRSVQSCDYPQLKLDIVYVDGGSTDKSVEIALSFDSVRVLNLKDKYPTPGKGRNKGWQSFPLPTAWIQFLDADTTLHPKWLNSAVSRIGGNTVAVCGHRRERFPDKNLFHIIGNMEWTYELGSCRYFGGDVLVKHEVLQRTGGFDETLVGGEDPELSYRIRQLGFEIQRMDLPMTLHDLNMTGVKQYFRRAFRSGYAYAEVALRYIGEKEKLWARELSRVVLKALAPVILTAAGWMADMPLLGFFLALLFLARPFLWIGKIKERFQQNTLYSLIYAGHSSLVVYPQFCGVARYIWGFFTHRPLRNKGYTDTPV